ncbi:MAG: hypothetical protein ACFFEV_00445 [Candidatus Thorarchaeota archaeon]
MNDDELNDIRQLIDLMQSGLVELFDQLRELRERLNLATELPSDSSPSIVPLFSEVKQTVDSIKTESSSDSIPEDTIDTDPTKETSLQDIVDDVENSSSTSDDTDPSTANAKVSRVLDPIARELRTGEATADIILEYLETAKEYLIDEDERKKKVSRDMDIVLNFLKARGQRGIRTEERDNILKRIRRWKAHLISYSSSPAE